MQELVSLTFLYVGIVNKMAIPLRSVIDQREKDQGITIIMATVIILEIIVPNWFNYLMIMT
jgi:hypothetical protein